MLIDAGCEESVNEVVLCGYTFRVVQQILVEGDRSDVALHYELAHEGNLHCCCLALARLVRKESEDLLTPCSADIFVLKAQGCHLGVVDLNFGNNTARALVVERAVSASLVGDA